ncbi:hypothetical protein C5C17_08555 [Pseudoclavibacter sp. RFBA6]|nr:hypothetical protein C5C17_08555 [Pseudoclavibacter sp. RFBA6]
MTITDALTEHRIKLSQLVSFAPAGIPQRRQPDVRKLHVTRPARTTDTEEKLRVFIGMHDHTVHEVTVTGEDREARQRTRPHARTRTRPGRHLILRDDGRPQERRTKPQRDPGRRLHQGTPAGIRQVVAADLMHRARLVARRRRGRAKGDEPAGQHLRRQRHLPEHRVRGREQSVQGHSSALANPLSAPARSPPPGDATGSTPPATRTRAVPTRPAGVTLARGVLRGSIGQYTSLT